MTRPVLQVMVTPGAGAREAAFCGAAASIKIVSRGTLGSAQGCGCNAVAVAVYEAWRQTGFDAGT